MSTDISVGTYTAIPVITRTTSFLITTAAAKAAADGAYAHAAQETTPSTILRKATISIGPWAPNLTYTIAPRRLSSVAPSSSK